MRAAIDASGDRSQITGVTTLLSLATLREKLQRVEDPVFGKPMLELGTLIDIEIHETQVSMKALVASSSRNVHERLRTRLQDLAAEAGATRTDVTIEMHVPTRPVLSDDPLPGVKNIILVMSGKGGVGKSTTAVNLTLALKQIGLRAGILDADIYGPSIPIMMGVSGAPISRDGKRIEPLSRFGVKMMSMGFLIEPKQAVIWRGPMLHGALQQFLSDVVWGELDFLIIDLPPGTGDVALTMAQKLKVTGVVMVTTPQEVALADVYKTVSMCDSSKLNLPVLGVIENMSYFTDPTGAQHYIFGRGGGQKVADYARAPLLAQIPMVQAVREGGDRGTPIVEAEPESEAGRLFLEVAHDLVEKTAQVHFARNGGEKMPTAKGPSRLRIVR